MRTSTHYWLIVLLAAALAGCSTVENTMGRAFTVKDYTAKSGERVMAGQAEPRTEYACQKIRQESEDWGLKGTMDRVTAIERVTRVAVDRAPAQGANYANIMVPADMSIGAINVNAFKDAQVGYYRCASLPAPAR